jgi:predicted transglutaminase-like cysteine proteinase
MGRADLTRSGPAEISARATPMPHGDLTMPPAGVLGFCVKYLAECAATGSGNVVVALDDRRRHELESIQAEVNAAIAPRAVPGHAWFYPVNGYGECNQYALEKRRELMALGWPREALLLTAAYTEGGEGHLVLVARTSAGDLVLDNRAGPVVDWSYLPYRWVSQQRAGNLVQWVSLEGAHASHASLQPARVAANN